MAHKMMKAHRGDRAGKFPPEADGEFAVVPTEEVTKWREKLEDAYGLGSGRLKVIEDPFVRV